MYHPFSIKETLFMAWKVIRENFMTVILFSAIISVIQIFVIPFIYLIVFDPKNVYTNLFIGVPLLLLMAASTLSLYKLIFVLIDQEFYEFEFRQILPRFRNVYRVAIIGFIIAAGAVFFQVGMQQLDQISHAVAVIVNITSVIATFYIGLRLQFTFCYILDDDSTIREAMMQSVELTRNNSWNMFLLFLIVVGLVALGFITFVIGIVFTYPFVNTLLVVSYRRLAYSKQDVDDQVTEMY
ncbi:MAG: glycerophosphoryl diester phosphodiesterase membrane domain-containing protein [Mucilaginibacter polytrichastri]|nr:glycerophosphoryl diester phosphodiesterase membrane domain-containing protein [Mucilaginibacter polytrichastri]